MTPPPIYKNILKVSFFIPAMSSNLTREKERKREREIPQIDPDTSTERETAHWQSPFREAKNIQVAHILVKEMFQLLIQQSHCL